MVGVGRVRLKPVVTGGARWGVGVEMLGGGGVYGMGCVGWR